MELLRQAAKRERSGTGVWWGAMAAVGGAAAVALLWRSHPTMAKAAAALWTLGWAAPLVAAASLRSPAPTGAPPKKGGGTWDQWRALCTGLGRMLAWGTATCPDREMREKMASAEKDLRDTLGAHPLKDDLERVCLRVATHAVAPLQTWFWREWLSGSAAQLRAEAERLMEEEEDEEGRMEILSGAMADGAAKAMRCLYPSMLATEQEAGADACVLAAWQGAKPGDPLVELAMALCLERGSMTRPWQPVRARAHALRLVRTGRAAADWYGGGEEEEGEPAAGAEVVSGAWMPLAEGAAGDGAAKGEESMAEAKPEAADGPHAAGGGAGATRHRVKIRVRTRSRRRHGRRRWGKWMKEWAGHQIWRAWNIMATFAQRVRYNVKLRWRHR